MHRHEQEIEIVHAGVPGRLRLRLHALKRSADLAPRLVDGLSMQPSILAAEARPLTGSLLLRHRADVGIDKILDVVARAVSEELQQGPEECAPQRRALADAMQNGDAPAWWHLPSEVVVERMGGDPVDGLTSAQAARRLARFGRNALPHEEPPSSFALFAKQFNGLPVMMLAGSATVSLVTGGVGDAIATLSVVLVNGVIGYVTEGEAERVIQNLMGSGRHPVVLIRDAHEVAIPAEQVVPGDLLVLRSGFQVAADARILSAEGLYIDESTLTGESLPVQKRPDRATSPEAPIGARTTMAHAGTIVTEGRGTALVVATATQTEAARTQALLSSTSRPQAPVEMELDRLGSHLAMASLAACGVFALLGVWRGYTLSVVLKDALALAVAAVPEGLPMVATTTMSLGLRKLEKKGILIRQMNAVESLGALQTLCLDKTGTLTQNRVTVVEAVIPDGTVGLDDPAAITLAEVSALNNDATIADGRPTGSSQTEQALLAFALGVSGDVPVLRARRPRTRTVERAPGRPWMATQHTGEGWPVLFKGSPEVILDACSHVLSGEGALPMDAVTRARLVAENERLASRPARVIGCAVGQTAPDEDNRLPDDLVFAGLLGMQDPLRPDAAAFVRRLQRAGIETVLITGDQAATAGAIAAELDLAQGEPLRIVDSTNLADLSPELLMALARETHVFTRVASHQKLAIVQALQSAGRVVGMTGDGVNDGPALSAADVGIAMGRSGADLARDVANVVIRDDELETLVDAIAEGRALYRNIRRALEFLITTNLSEIGVSMVEAVHGPGELETPMELLWINMVTDVLPGLGLALAGPDHDVLQRPPRARDEPIIPPDDMRRMGLDSGLIAASSLGAHFAGLARYGPGPETRGMTFLALSQAQLLYTLVCQRTDPRHLHPERLLENERLDLALLLSSGLAVLPFFVPGLRRLLGIAPLGAADVAVSLGAATLPFAAVLGRRGIELAIEELEERP